MSRLHPKEWETALTAVRLASTICQNVQHSITADVLEKKDKSPVTVADFASQAAICRTLSEHFPDDPIIAEEDSAELRSGSQSMFRDRVIQELARAGLQAAGDQACDWIDRGGTSEAAPRFWTLDPIDGTKGFVRREQYAVSLAMIVDGRIEIGVLGCPNLPIEPGSSRRGVLFAAVRGEGAVAIPLDGSAAAKPIRVRGTTDLREAILCESVESGHSDHDVSSKIAAALRITSPPVRLDSQAKYAVVARGEADLYLRLPTRANYREKIWDHAGGVLVVEEAGGAVCDIAGRPLEWTHGRALEANRGVVVTQPALQSRVLEAVAASGIASE